MPVEDPLETLVSKVLESGRYRTVDPALIRRLGAQELSRGRSLKDAIKEVKSRLHQVGGAYVDTGIDFSRCLRALEDLPPDLHHPDVTDFCRRLMAQHASTRERLPFLERFYAAAFSALPPVKSIFDLACGLNPLSIPWMGLPAGVQYRGCDIFSDLVAFLNRFFEHFAFDGQVEVRDLAAGAPRDPVDLALLLKTIPCLEQIDKQAGIRLLDSLQVRFVLVSFPVSSLGGRGKGMPANYESHFWQLVAGREWNIQKLDLAGELGFLIDKGLTKIPA